MSGAGPRPLRVLHVISGLTIGGAEMMLYKLLRATTRVPFDLHQQGDHNTDQKKYQDPVPPMDATVLSLSTGGELAPDIRALGVRVRELPMPGGLPGRGFRRDFLQVLHETEPDVVAAWMYRANAVCSVLLPREIPLVWHVRQSLDHTSSQRLRFRFTRRVNRWILRYWPGRAPALILYNSRTSRDQHRAAGYLPPERGTGPLGSGDAVIPNGFEMERFRPDAVARAAVRVEWGLQGVEDVVVFGIVGRHHPIKNHFGFVEAVAIARDQLERSGGASREYPFRCVMVGRDLDRNNGALLREIESRGLADRFVLLGERRDLPRVYAGLDVMVSSSLVEAFPNVLGEAMAAGLPCVATAVGDSAWVVDDTGLTVPGGDTTALGTALATAARWTAEERRRRGALARARVQAEFSLDAVAREFVTAYRDVAEGGAGRGGVAEDEGARGAVAHDDPTQGGAT